MSVKVYKRGQEELYREHTNVSNISYRSGYCAIETEDGVFEYLMQNFKITKEE